MAKGFRYYATPDEVRQYLAELGHEMEDHYNPYEKKVTGFTIHGTTVELAYDIVIDGRVVGQGLIGLHNNRSAFGYTPEKAERSLKLYRKLYRRFSKPQNKTWRRRQIEESPTTRRFRYYATHEEVRQYLAELGYKTEDFYSEDGNEVEGFIVQGTTVRLGYDLKSTERSLADGKIGLYNDPSMTGSTSKAALRSLELYQKLYERFHKSASI